MQAQNKGHLPKRSRYYQSMIDLNVIEKGAYYKQLQTSFVIFICTFDLFKKGRHIYTFQNICKEDNTLHLGDETTKVFLNTKGTMEDVNEDVKAFLRCVEGTFPPENAFAKRIEQAITKVKNNQKWKVEYMNLLLRDMENREEGREEGRKEGHQAGIGALVLDNLEEGKTEAVIVEKLKKRFQLDEDQAKLYYTKVLEKR